MSGDVSNSGTNPGRNPATSSGANPTPSRANLRTFIAIDLPAPILDALAATQDRLRLYLRAYDGVLRWSPTKNLHLTLRFFGDTTARKRAEVTARLQEVTAHTTPFTLSVDVSESGLGGFPNLRQPRVLWSGVGGELESLTRLQAQVEAVAQAVGFAAEEKSYSPHLTLARAAREADRRAQQQVGQAISDFARQASEAEQSETGALSFAADRLIFYQSELGAGGSHYSVLAEFPFGGD